MLDSSPLPIPPPKKLKRTASVASLPSPPPSVEHLKKRTTTQRFGSDTESETDDEVEEAAKGHKVVGRKLLFPPGASTSSFADNLDNPFLDNSGPSNVREQLAIDAVSSPSTHRAVAPVSPPPSRRKTSKGTSTLPRTPSPMAHRERCSASELPVLDEKNNPFLASSPPKLRRPRSPRDLAEQPTLTYVFKGIKTSIPNPNYNLPESAHERSRLPLSHPDYSPPPMRAPRRLFPEAFPSANNAEEVDDDSSDEVGVKDADLQTPDMKPRLSKVFVDAAGKPLPDSGPQGVRGKTMDAQEVGRMAVGPIRGRG